MNQASMGGFYTSAGSNIPSGSTVVVGQAPGGAQQNRSFAQQQVGNALPQNFVVVSQQSNSCGCTQGYAMSCDSPNCVNKFHHASSHMSHTSTQQIGTQVTTTSNNNQLITYTLPQASNASSIMPAELLHDIGGNMSEMDNVHDIESDEVKPQLPLRRQRLAEMARLRYQNLSSEEKKAVNSRRMLLRKRKRQREREMEELEAILRQSNDIEEDVIFIGNIREKRQRESRAKAARSRYQNMSSEERRNYNQKRRLRQIGTSSNGDNIDPAEQEQIKLQIAQQNARKAELARQRYHRMSVEERKQYNRRRTESLRRRRLEEEALLATPAGQIDAESLHKAQQIMIRNAIRAEKARQRYKRKAPEERERKRTTTGSGRARKSTGGIGDLLMNNNLNVQNNDNNGIRRDTSEEGDILSAIERDVIRRTQEAKHVLEQRSSNTNILPSTSTLLSSPINTMTFKREIPMEPQQPHLINVCQMPMNSSLPAGQTFAIQQGQGVNISGPGLTNIGGNIITGDIKSGVGTTKYLPAGTAQGSFIFSDGQFVAIQPQEPIQGYAVDQHQNNFENNNFHQLNPATTTVLRANPGNNPTIVNGPQSQQLIIGQRVELIQAPSISGNGPGADSGGGTIQYHQVLNYQHPQSSNVVNAYGQQLVPQIQQQIHTPQPPQPQQSAQHRGGRGRQNANVDIDEKILNQKAKRAERARRRYHEMSAEQRHEFNAKRAMALKMARLKDDELCRMGDEYELTGAEMSEELRQSIQQARIRRSKRAESARQKYQKMTPEQRKAHNAMRDAQRRQRKREIEENKNSDDHQEHLED